ncbi:glycoside hydrolase family 17 protein [Karstenula rhodostoma CBS 690.94]|uniref:glucan endo-1,3-beta-D-glucosidase n=1 Tax=Karstenula rhodostoma CBS 690.94 TaxID=1392251 RepID=A0A9P4P7V9_9PLEO|nr:glycoside hydrolase family 17 protein [Karstenula rhodostoma CBS 690.94]
MRQDLGLLLSLMSSRDDAGHWALGTGELWPPPADWSSGSVSGDFSGLQPNNTLAWGAERTMTGGDKGGKRWPCLAPRRDAGERQGRWTEAIAQANPDSAGSAAALFCQPIVTARLGPATGNAPSLNPPITDPPPTVADTRRDTCTMAYQPPHHYHDERDVSPVQPDSAMIPPPPPPHRTPVAMDNPYAQPQGPGSNNYSDYSTPEITPGADNLGAHAAGGGINGLATDLANSHERESGVQAMRDMGTNNYSSPMGVPPHNTPFADAYAYDAPTPPRPIHSPYNVSNQTLGSGPFGAAGAYSSASSMHSSQHSAPLTSPTAVPYSDNPYTRYSSSHLDLAPQMAAINPNEVADDDDWGMTHAPGQGKRQSRGLFTRESAAGAGAGAAVAAGAAAGVAVAGSSDGSGSYNSVPTTENVVPAAERGEKSEWLEQQNHGRKKLMWMVVAVIAIVVVGAILGGVLGTALNKHGGGSAGSGKSSSEAASDVAEDNKHDLSINSDEIKKLMNNQNLHKVFPGMDYTPLNSQYPDCMHIPPSQNNITRDMAVMSQLTNAVRLYGTDCNQTDMILHSIDRLELTDMKVWLGVWLGNNDTTNDRQVSNMWEIIDKHVVPKWKDGKDHQFKGVIVGNEVLFRKDLTKTELLKYITTIRDNITSLGKKHNVDDTKLPIALSDLGDNWTSDMATKVDIVMSNVHPFFAGVEVDKAAGWTWDFWTGHDVALTASNASIKQVIAEVGWPTGGGNDCGESDCTSDTQGSVAGVTELNQFMEDWICPSMKNATEYFW